MPSFEISSENRENTRTIKETVDFSFEKSEFKFLPFWHYYSRSHAHYCK